MSRRRSVVFIPVAVVALLGGLSVVQRIGRTTRRDRRQRGVSLEPGRGDDAHRVPGAERRCATGIPDQHGHGAGRRLRRGQRDRAEEASAVSAQEARGCEGVDDAAVATAAYDVLSELVSTAPDERSVPGSRGTPGHALHGVRGIARRDRQWLLQEAGHRDRARGGRGHARRERWATDGSGRPSGCRTRPGHWQPLLNATGAADPRSDPVGGRREAVPHRELVAVPQRATAGAQQRAVGGGVQRGQEPRQSHRLDPD